MPTKKANPSDGNLRRQITSHDGSVTFVLEKTRAGIHMERRQRVDIESCTGFTTMHALFLNEAEFLHYCEADDLRFICPHVFNRLAREFHDLRNDRSWSFPKSSSNN